MPKSYLLTLARASAFAAALGASSACDLAALARVEPDNTTRNMLIGALAIEAANCAKYADNPISNPLYTGGSRFLYHVSSCTPSSWNAIGFDSSGSTQVSTGPAVVTTAPFSGYGTNVEVTFTAISSSGTLDLMTYGAGSASAGLSTSSPAVQLMAGSSCALQYRKSTDSLLYNVSTCTDSTTITAGRSYTYCIDFDRGTGSGGSYGFGNMLAAWSKPCADIPISERDQMSDVKLMQMMTIPAMNPSTSTVIGFSTNGIRLQTIRIGNTLYASAM